MLYVVAIIWLFKLLYCVSVVFMMKKMKSVGVLINQSSYQFDMPKKAVEKVVMGGASTKTSCFVPQYNIDTTLPQPDNTQRLLRMIEEIS